MSSPKVGGRVRAVSSLNRAPTLIESFVGFLGATFFSVAYYLAPVYIMVSPFVLLRAPLSPYTWAFLAPMIISAITPSGYSHAFLTSYVMKCVPKYFNYSEILEFDDDDLIKLGKQRPVVMAAQPHGVLSYSGICSAICDYSNPNRSKVVRDFPTAVASVLLYIPILKHVLGVFGLIDVSKRNLFKHMKDKKGSLVIYVGGIAELFLSSPSEEMIIARKGFIKLAMQTGADVVPLYLFGNTTVLKVIRHPILAAISRKMGASLTFFWGRWGLPLPLPRPVTYVRGTPLGLPQIDNPTDEDVTKWLQKYMDEVQRLFDTYKKFNPDYKDKTLKISAA